MEAAAHFAIWTLVAAMLLWAVLYAALNGAGDL